MNLQQELLRAKKDIKISLSGVVTQVIGLLIESHGPAVHLGELCHVYNRHGVPIPCEVVGFKEDKVLLMSLGEMTEIAPGAEVELTGRIHMIPVGEDLQGRIIDALGNPLDDKGPIKIDKYYPVMATPPPAMKRELINEVMPTGVKAIDALCTLGLGQRMGIFSNAGLGKSILLSIIAKMSRADVNVIALIGERGREVREFVENNLGPLGLARSVVVAVTSDQAALLRTKGAHAAMAIAEYFRDQGKNVIFMMDSLTRYAMALRETGLAIGEPPTSRGYTPSVFAMLPKLLERAGTSEKGAITGIYSVLVEGDEWNDPIAETVKAILDGHIVLSKKLASSNHYPAIDILNSLSRMMPAIVTQKQFQTAARLRETLQTFREAEDLINIGAYVRGSNPKIDQAMALMPAINQFLKQNMFESYPYDETQNLLDTIFYP